MNYYLASGELFPIYDPLVMWGATSYEKGASVLHMLRHVVGDSTFFAILNAYGNQYAFSNALTPDFQALCESLHGQNLDWFYDEWIYDWAYPQYVYTYWQAGPDTVKVLVTQEQPVGPVFTMPVDIRLGMASGDTVVMAWVDESPETLTIVFPGANTDSFAFDPDDWILKLVRNEPGVAERKTRSTLGTGQARIRAFPNPFSTICKVYVEQGYAYSNTHERSLVIYDLAGRQVRSFVLERNSDRGAASPNSGSCEVIWDGRNDHGLPVPGGVYFYRLDDRQSSLNGKLVLLR
jgi:hypothetical protein